MSSAWSDCRLDGGFDPVPGATEVTTIWAWAGMGGQLSAAEGKGSFTWSCKAVEEGNDLALWEERECDLTQPGSTGEREHGLALTRCMGAWVWEFGRGWLYQWPSLLCCQIS